MYINIICFFKSVKPLRKKNSQLAEKLGMCSSRWSKNSSGDNGSLGTSSNFVDHTSLSIFGNPHEFDYVPVEYVVKTKVFTRIK
jgi:hypothetical protein